MLASIRRRGFLALAGIGGSWIAAGVRAHAGASTAPTQRSNMTRHIVEVPADNQVFGNSVEAFEEWRYSPAVRAGGLLFIAGVVGVRKDGSIPDSIEEQADLTFRRIVEILRLEGLDLNDLVEMVSYHVDLRNTLPIVRTIKDRYIRAPFPTWTVLGIEALGSPELKLEIRCIAALRG